MNEIAYAGERRPENCPAEGWSLVLCRFGTPHLLCEGRDVPLQLGQVALVPPGLDYQLSGEAADACRYLVLLRPTLGAARFAVLEPPFFSMLDMAVEACCYHYRTESPLRITLLAAYGALIAAYLIPVKQPSRHSGIVLAITDHIMAHYTDSGYELDTYLRTLPFSYDYLRKLFQQEMGLTPHQFLMERRLQSAAMLLTQDSLGCSMAEVARLSGFREPLYFSRMFKKRFGAAPSYYALNQQQAGA